MTDKRTFCPYILKQLFSCLIFLSIFTIVASSIYAQPGTVLSYQKISDTQGTFGGTIPNSALFGQGLANIGDINCDGVEDMAVGAQGTDDGATNSGAIWILFMNADGTVSDEQKISNGNGGLPTGTLLAYDNFGNSIVGIGDLNADGVPDIAVGNAFRDDGGINRGAVWILFMKDDGTVNTTPAPQVISSTSGFQTFPSPFLDDRDAFGTSVASLGDFDGDNVVDIAVGAAQDDDGGTDKGAVWLLFLDFDDNTKIVSVKSHKKIADGVGGFGTGTTLGAYDRFSMVSPIGDLDDDGVMDIAVGAFLDDDEGANRGAVWILFLNSDGTVKLYQKISDLAGGFLGTLSNDANFGISITSMEDMDCDGVEDIAVGAWRDDDGGNERGSVFILFLNTNGTVKSYQQISDTKGNFPSGELDNVDRFGVAITRLGDLNNDGLIDLAVGARHDDDGGTDRGAVWVLFEDACSNKLSGHKTHLGRACNEDRYFGDDVYVWPNGDLIGVYGYWVGENDFCNSRIETRVSTQSADNADFYATSAQTIFNWSDGVFNTGLPVGESTYGVHSASFLPSDDLTELYVFFLVKSRTNTCPSCEKGTSACNYLNRVFWSKIPLTGVYGDNPWSTPEEIGTISGYNIMINSRAIRLSNGTIALASCVSNSIVSLPNFRSYVIYSSDEGFAWATTTEVSNTTAGTSMVRGYMEPDIIEIDDAGTQKIMMVMRTASLDLFYSTIGITDTDLADPTGWDELASGSPGPNALAFPPGGGAFPDVANNTNTVLERVCNGDIIMVFNEHTTVTTDDKARNKLVSMTSSNEGLNWGQKNIIEYNNTSLSFLKYPARAYPSIRIHEDKLMLIYNEQMIWRGPSNQVFRSYALSDFTSYTFEALAGIDQTIICSGSVTLNGGSTGGSGSVTFSWSPTTGLSDPNIADPIASPSTTTVYTLAVTDANGCTSTDNMTVTVTDCAKLTSIENEDAIKSVSIYPNPTRGTVMVQVRDNGEANSEISVHTVRGEKLVVDQKPASRGQFELDLNNHEGGIYIIRIVTGNQVINKRVVLVK